MESIHKYCSLINSEFKHQSVLYTKASPDSEDMLIHIKSMKLSPSPKKLFQKSRKIKKESKKISLLSTDTKSLFLGARSIKITRKKKNSSSQVDSTHSSQNYPYSSSINLVINREVDKTGFCIPRTPHPAIARTKYFNQRKKTYSSMSRFRNSSNKLVSKNKSMIEMGQSERTNLDSRLKDSLDNTGKLMKKYASSYSKPFPMRFARNKIKPSLFQMRDKSPSVINAVAFNRDNKNISSVIGRYRQSKFRKLLLSGQKPKLSEFAPSTPIRKKRAPN
ncbi:unnamed protein product [Moneuplotes crassus]|uniref:Uncharacterized protein n=1 Tax=Euplotes crassus TaxID=5936 RepID=A0AAD1UNC8_EUPCR|nr:unnamed protein product [Moneuplotes crassus]